MLSSSEATWIDLSEADKEVMFVIQLLGDMKILVELPFTVRVNNIGAMFMASNIATTSHTEHIGIRFKYINEYTEDRVVKIIFVKSTENYNDILTKNVSVMFHEEHSKNDM